MIDWRDDLSVVPLFEPQALDGVEAAVPSRSPSWPGISAREDTRLYIFTCDYTQRRRFARLLKRAA
jgi:hypothetical protein